MDTELDMVRAVLDLNTIGTISLTKTLLPHMIQQRSGAIVVMSSITGKMGLCINFLALFTWHTGVPGVSSYGASKHALQVRRNHVACHHGKYNTSHASHYIKIIYKQGI